MDTPPDDNDEEAEEEEELILPGDPAVAAPPSAAAQLVMAWPGSNNAAVPPASRKTWIWSIKVAKANMSTLHQRLIYSRFIYSTSWRLACNRGQKLNDVKTERITRLQISP